jgi:hypothetical protein
LGLLSYSGLQEGFPMPGSATSRDAAADAEATFAPDGHSLFFKYAAQDEEVYHQPRLERVAWPAGGAAIGNTLENWSALQRMQVPSRLLVWPDAWHWILKPEDSRHFYEEVHAWLARYLGGQEPPARVAQR